MHEQKGNINILKLQYEYDNQGNVIKRINHVDPTYSLTALSYDGLDRLTSTTGTSGIGSSLMAYDGLGNITQYHTKGEQLDYSYNTTSNRLDNVTNASGSKVYNFNNGYDSKGKDNVRPALSPYPMSI